MSLAAFGQWLSTIPTSDRAALADGVWQDKRDTIRLLIENGIIFTDSRSELEGVVTAAGWDTDVADTRRDLAIHGRSWFRWFRGTYRNAQATLRGILRNPPPRPLEDRLSILDSLIKGQESLRAIRKNQVEGQHAFGELWRKKDSDWRALSAIETWVDERPADAPQDFRSIVAGVSDFTQVKPRALQLADQAKTNLQEVEAIFAEVQLDLLQAFSQEKSVAVPLLDLVERLEAWRTYAETITKWIAYRLRREKLQGEGLSELVQRLHDGRIKAHDASDQFQMAYYESIMRQIAQREPDIAFFEGTAHERTREEFKKRDQERIELARQEVALTHYQGIPTGNAKVGEIGMVRHEMHKKRRFIPLRQLLKKAGMAIQAIKPVFMMSPMSIAQYLEPGGIDFDLLLIDEASQVRPVDALGSVCRAKRMVVMGDDKQLPPTRFFSKVLGEDIAEAMEDEFQAADTESILDLCAAQNMPSRMLRWHYRSQHHSLIAVSNRAFYDNHLYVVPSPFNDSPHLGLRFHHIRDGVFDRGGSATNRIEAQAVAKAVLEHARKYTDLSLGVGAFSVSQRDIVLDELARLRRTQEGNEQFFSADLPEPFFVKNLETIQGDERDVIFISVGYAKDSSGFMAMTFGPLSAQGGERRLNVLITRARRRCEVFSSITADDIDTNRAKGHGPHVFKEFLSYAETGNLDVPKPPGHEICSPFEEEVAKAVAANGYKLTTQVGVAGFFIDLAVVDPDRPGRYLLGVECDGATYHSSRSARDRDRLRQQVLEDRGWIIYRIWSTDWFYRPEEQLRKVLAAIEEAKVEMARRRDAPPTHVNEPAQSKDGELHIERRKPPTDSPNGETEEYQEASFSVQRRKPPHKLSVSNMSSVVTKIVEIEGPIHRDEVARRVTRLWELNRIGRRIVGAVVAGLRKAVQLGHISQQGQFYTRKGQRMFAIRNREHASPTLRKAEMIPPQEIGCALMAVVKAHLGVRPEDAMVEVGRLFGFGSTRAQLRDVISVELKRLVNSGSLQEKNGALYST